MTLVQCISSCGNRSSTYLEGADSCVGVMIPRVFRPGSVMILYTAQRVLHFYSAEAESTAEPTSQRSPRVG